MEIRHMGIRKDNYIKEIEWHTQSYFDDKTSGADIPERAEEAIQERIETLIADINNLINEAENDVDDIIYEFSEENLKDIKADLKYQDKKEADLWNWNLET